MLGNDAENNLALVELFNLVYQAGLFDELSAKTREWIANNEELMKLVATSKQPKLEPRLTPNEYISHVLKLFSVPAHQADFYITITKICYLMLLAEKNPMVAQQLKGVLALGDDLKSIMKL